MNDEYFSGTLDLGGQLAVSLKADDWISNCMTGINAEGSVATCESITAVPYEFQTTTIEASPWNGTYVAGGTDYVTRSWEEAEKELTEILSKQIDDEILKMLSLKRYEMKHEAYHRRKSEIALPVTEKEPCHTYFMANNGRYLMRRGMRIRRRGVDVMAEGLVVRRDRPFTEDEFVCWM